MVGNRYTFFFDASTGTSLMENVRYRTVAYPLAKTTQQDQAIGKYGRRLGASKELMFFLRLGVFFSGLGEGGGMAEYYEGNCKADHSSPCLGSSQRITD